MMKVVFAFALMVLAGAASADTDWGTFNIDVLMAFSAPGLVFTGCPGQPICPSNQRSSYAATPVYNDTVEFTTQVDQAPLTVTVRGSMLAHSGSGRGGGYHSEIDVAHVNWVALNQFQPDGTLAAAVDSAGTPATCVLTQTINTGRQAPQDSYQVWQCSMPAAPVGSYQIMVNGEVTSTGNIPSLSAASTLIYVQTPIAQVAPPPPPPCSGCND